MSTPADAARALRRGDFPVLRVLPTRWSDDDTYGHVMTTRSAPPTAPVRLDTQPPAGRCAASEDGGFSG